MCGADQEEWAAAGTRVNKADLIPPVMPQHWTHTALMGLELHHDWAQGVHHHSHVSVDACDGLRVSIFQLNLIFGPIFGGAVIYVQLVNGGTNGCLSGSLCSRLLATNIAFGVAPNPLI